MKIAVLLMFLSAADSKGIHSFAGPYIDIVDVFYMCPPDMRGRGWELYYRVSHFNPAKPFDKQRFWGNMTTGVTLDDSMWDVVGVLYCQLGKDTLIFEIDLWMPVTDCGGKARAVMDVRSNNQWKENAFVFNFPKQGCRAFRDNMPDFFRLAYGVTMKGACRIPPGTYIVNVSAVDWSSANFPVMPYGKYRFSMLMGQQNSKTPYYCAIAEVRLVPKPS